MPVIKCKMCGGDLKLTEGSTICECEYCGTRQTVPRADDEKKLRLFERANRLRAACEFDKAAGVYESIVADFDEEAEAWWGLILCRFGIEYVDDPASGRKVPTCHRSSFDSLMDDPNFDMVMECADPVARKLYREEARQIEELRKRILEVSSREEPYDVFISYKELDEEGQRTLDSVIAQDIYRELTNEGCRVFFSRISLEDKLGTEYEPYIFAALHSARVMLVVGTDFERFNAVWVKNEWSRFLALIAAGQKKTLIPVFKGIDAYDMPKEFRKLAAQDMDKVGAMQDLVRGVEKLLGKNGPAKPTTTGGPNAAALLDRGRVALEDGEWDRAKGLFEQVLSMDSHSGEAYLGLAMAELQCKNRGVLSEAYTKANAACRSDRNIARARRLDSALDALFAQLDTLAQQADGTVRKARESTERRLKEVRERNAAAAGRLAAGKSHSVALRADGRVLAAGENEDGRCEVSGWRDITAIAAGERHTLGLRADGKVLAAGDNESGQCEVSDWTDITAIAAGAYHSVGLRADGTVVAAGENGRGQCEVSGWRDIVAVAVVSGCTVGLRADGTVVTTRGREFGRSEVSDWTEIAAVAVGDNQTVGLRSDGSAVNDRVSWDTGAWSGIVAVTSGEREIAGLRADGTVLAEGFDSLAMGVISGWTELVAIEAKRRNLIALRADGSCVAVGQNQSGQCNVYGWRNVVAVAAGWGHTLGLRADGSVVAVGSNDSGQCEVSDWKLFGNLAGIEAEREAAARKAETERLMQLKKLNAERAALQAELANLKGLFTGKRRRELEARLAELAEELKELE